MREDITERRQLENQLRESQKMEAVGQLAGGIAHDFNNAMQIIINSAHLIRVDPKNTKSVVDFVDIILQSGQRSANMTRQLLGFSRRAEIQLQPIDLNVLLSDLMKLVARVIGEDIDLEFKREEDLSWVAGDSSQLQQVVLNLCLNARDAMPEGGRLVIAAQNHHADQEFCSAHGWETPGPYVMLSVSDTGVGMEPEIREHVFEPFFTTKEIGEGTGLGLAMVYGIVKQHNGRIEISSEPKVGTTFQIYFPGTEPPESIETEPALEEVPGGSETILVAEDEVNVLKLLSESLQSKGYQVLCARDGEEAVSVFGENAARIDLVILDMVMPKLRGREVYEQICKKAPNPAVLFSTGYSPNNADAEFLGAKGLPLIQKPYSPDELFTAVREVLDHR